MVVIVGAGIMGTCAAWSLSAAGHQVSVYDQHPRDHALGGSHGATRVFREGYVRPHHMRLVGRARQLWASLAAECGVPLIDQVGGLDHGTTAQLLQRARSLRAFGVPHELLTPAAASRRWPSHRFQEGPVLFQPRAGRIRAAEGLRLIRELAERAGARFMFETPVRGIQRAGEEVEIELGAQTVRSSVVVVTAGGWAPQLVGHLTAVPPLLVRLEQPAHFAPTLDGHEWPSVIHHREHPHVGTYALGTPGVGLKVAHHHAGRAVDPRDLRRDIDPRALQALCDYVAEWVPGVDPEPVEVSTCLYDDTPDLDFAIGRDGPVVLATGFSGHGFKFAPAVGVMVRDLVEGGPALRAPEPEFAPGRAMRAGASPRP